MARQPRAMTMDADEIANLTQDEADELKAQVEQWATRETKPMHDRMQAIDREIAALRDEKDGLHRQVDDVERESADRRYALRGPDAGEDQVLEMDVAVLDEHEIARLRRLVERYDRAR